MHQRRDILHWTPILFLLCICAVSVAIGSSGGPDPSLTGAPSEADCTDCHSTNPLNTGGTVEVFGAPQLYQPGVTYDITVRLTSGQTAANTNRRWGFQLTAIRDDNGSGAGTFANVAGQGTEIVAGSGSLSSRRYIQHTSSGTRSGVASPVQWQTRWTAPNASAGAITLYFAGLAGNGTGSGGDWVYVSSKSLQDTTTSARTFTWGQVKNRYRR